GPPRPASTTTTASPPTRASLPLNRVKSCVWAIRSCCSKFTLLKGPPMANEPSPSAPAAGSAPKTSDYAMGSTDRERQRLMQQGAVLRGCLASAFRAAGIGPGMRVLDLGCGVGDVAMLAADLVGPTGSVVGIDRDAAS